MAGGTASRRPAQIQRPDPEILHHHRRAQSRLAEGDGAVAHPDRDHQRRFAHGERSRARAEVEGVVQGQHRRRVSTRH